MNNYQTRLRINSCRNHTTATLPHNSRYPAKPNRKTVVYLLQTCLGAHRKNNPMHLAVHNLFNLTLFGTCSLCRLIRTKLSLFGFFFLSLAAEALWICKNLFLYENGDHCPRYTSFSSPAVCLLLLNMYTEARLLRS